MEPSQKLSDYWYTRYRMARYGSMEETACRIRWERALQDELQKKQDAQRAREARDRMVSGGGGGAVGLAYDAQLGSVTFASGTSISGVDASLNSIRDQAVDVAEDKKPLKRTISRLYRRK